MVNKILTSITDLPVGDIVVSLRRLRPVSAIGVTAICASIEELGVMKDPIHVRKVKHRGGVIELMAGGHRLEAAKRLGWETIPVTCWECTDDFAQLMEIDDNLAGAELTYLDTAVFLAARKDVYERLHPEAKQGGARGNQHTGGWQTDTMSFCHATAEKFGLTDRHVRRLVSAGEKLAPNEVAQLRGAPRPVALADLMEIGKIGEASERQHVVGCLVEGKARNARDARRQWTARDGSAPAPLSPTDAAYRRLLDAWVRAPKAAKRRFLEDKGDEVASVLSDVMPSGHPDGSADPAAGHAAFDDHAID